MYSRSGLTAECPSSRATQLARTVSDICSPAALAPPCLLLAVWASPAPGTIWYALLYFAIAIPLPLWYVVWLVRTGRVPDFHLPRRCDRTGPFAVSLASALLAVVLLIYCDAPAAFLAPIVAVFAQTLALFAVTLAWQISVHTATTAGLASFAILALGKEATMLAALVPLVTWARLHLGRHTLAQCIAGAIVGCATFITLFALRGVAW
jgi:hypothetical protein